LYLKLRKTEVVFPGLRQISHQGTNREGDQSTAGQKSSIKIWRGGLAAKLYLI